MHRIHRNSAEGSATNRWRRTATLATVVSAVAIGLAACSSSSTASTTTTGASKTLLIGSNAIESGPAATSFDITQGFEAYLNYTNSLGGVNGYKFRSTVQDNAYSATQAVEAESKLEADHPFAISVIGTVPAAAVVPVAKSQRNATPLYVAADGAQVDSLTSSTTQVWGVVPSYPRLAAFDASFILKSLKTTSFAVAYEDDSLAQGADASLTSYVPANGGKLLANVAVQDSTTNYVPVATQLQASGAKTVLVWSDTPIFASIQKAAAQIGYHPQWVTPFFSLSSGYLSLAGSSAEGTYVDGFLPPATANTAAMQTYVTWVSKISPSAVDGGTQGWELAAALVAGIKGATQGGGALNPSTLSAAMKKIDGTVALGTLNYTSGQHWGSTQAAMYQVQNGKFVQVQGFGPLPS
jgi:branched-chain amino acid transport system substrate-binding protein